jgi:hypothetical protein
LIEVMPRLCFSFPRNSLIIGPPAFFRSRIVIQLYRSLPCSLVVLVLTACQALGDEKAASFAELKDKVDRRVADWQPTSDEKRFDQIGWCTSLLEAEKLAREHRRPIFLFTHDGRMNVGRC